MADKLIPWRTVELWPTDGREWADTYDSAVTEAARARVLAALREYRDGGAMLNYWLVDPSEYDANCEAIDGSGELLTDAGPQPDAIDWTGIDDADEEAA